VESELEYTVREWLISKTNFKKIQNDAKGYTLHHFFCSSFYLKVNTRYSCGGEMKKIPSFLLITLFILSSFCLCACTLKEVEGEEYLRIHIRANSNSKIDQDIKYEIKDYVIDYLTPLIATCSNKEEMENTVSQNILNINAVCDEILAKNGFKYASNAKVCKEYFPTRAYGELTLEQGYYDALIVELGEAGGNNWWCVVYPPLCFVNAKEIDGKNFKYKSRIMELING